MKRLFLAIFLVALLLLLGGFFFLKAKNSRFLPSQAEIGNDIDQRFLNSFKGVLDLEPKTPVVPKSEENIQNQLPSPTNSTEKKTEGKAANSENNFAFAVLGDTQYFRANNPQGNFQKAVAKIKERNPDLVIAVGDLVGNCRGENEDAQDYINWKNILGELAPKTYAVQGNHDRIANRDKCDQFWQNTFNFPINGPDGFSETVYSLDFKNSHFVFLDSEKPDVHTISSTQRSWLEEDLSKNKKENTFVFFHEPAYPVSSKIGESLDAEPAERNALWQILEKYKVTAVFNGHEHLVSRRKIGNIYQFVFGNTDSFNHEMPKPGVAEYANQGQGRFGWVKVNGQEITVETYGPDGSLLNTFTFSK